MEKEILLELQEIKKLLQVIVSNQEQSIKIRADREAIARTVRGAIRGTPPRDRLIKS